VETLTHADVLARFGAALSDPTRSRILLALRGEPAYPADLAEALGVSRQSLSNHLTCLRGCGLDAGQRGGDGRAVAGEGKPHVEPAGALARHHDALAGGVGREQLAHLPQGAAAVGGVQVDVVDVDDDVGGGLGGGRRRGVGGRGRRGSGRRWFGIGRRRRAVNGALEVRQIDALAVVEETEVAALEIGDDAAVGVAHFDVDGDDVDLDRLAEVLSEGDAGRRQQRCGGQR